MEPPDLRKRSTNPLPAVHSYTITRHVYGNDAFQFGDLYLPGIPGPHPVVPLLHGGFWRAAYNFTLMDGLADYLARRGIAAWNIEYRRVGNKGGGWPGTLHDVAQAVDYLRTIAAASSIDLRRVVPVGHSAGGHLAFWLAGRHRLPHDSPLTLQGKPLSLAGTISLAGAVDLELVWRLKLSNDAVGAFLGGRPADVSERYSAASPAALLPLGVPQILIHGDKDTNVPLEVSKTYTQKAREAGDSVKLIELTGGDHFVVINPSSEAWSLTMQELQGLLG